MKKIGWMILLCGSAYMFAGCSSATTPAANNGNSGNTAAANSNAAAKPAAQPATLEAIAAIEKAGWDAAKNKDQKTFEPLLSDRIVDFGKDGRMDKAAIMKAVFDPTCEVKSFSWADQRLTNLSPDVAVLTFTATQDASCGGKKLPSPSHVATVYAREGDAWKNILYMEQPVIDPKNQPKSYPAPSAAPKADDSKPDATTDQLMTIEKKAWEAWKERDKAGVEGVMAANFMYYGATGLDDRAAMVKRWGEAKCEGLDYTLADAKGFAVTPDVMLVTYRADAKGKCDGHGFPPSVWVGSFDIKQGADWKNAFYIDMPRQ